MQSRLATIFLAAVTAAAFTPTLEAQTREKKPQAKDFPEVTKEANELFEKKEYGKALEKLQKAMLIAIDALEKMLDGAMPADTEQFKRVKKNKAARNPFVSMMMGLNAPFTFNYRAAKGHQGNISVVVTRKSPVVKTLSYAFKAAELDPNQEVIGYKEHKGLFKKTRNGKGFELMITLWEEHLIQITATGIDEKSFFAMFSQAFVDLVAKILGK